ncbi:hypothetical protein JOH50_001747 [Rhizobium leguminosarum]|uniref:DUF2293 domain-containing protein n=1 Tax=Rhizobium leguminosarum TaxID=384 RepID=UPI001AE2E6D3|nr:DUF2293 domain-containing protein [Rhizobium leguminosarum]MBP2486020.1 hypothetical protein [Rhizobium leguminosarum]
MAKFNLSAIERHIRHHHPGCPDFAVTYFTQGIAGKDWLNASLGQAVGITMQTFLRHEMTDYDTLLLHGVDRSEARRRVQPRVAAMLNSWKSSRSRSAHPANLESKNMESVITYNHDEHISGSDTVQALTSDEVTEEASEPPRQKPVGMTFNMERDWHTKFKMTAVSRGMDMRQLLIESFAAWEREQK